MFMSVYGLSLLGLMEADPLLIQAEQRLISQAEELVVLVDSSKFAKQGRPDPVRPGPRRHRHHRHRHRQSRCSCLNSRREAGRRPQVPNQSNSRTRLRPAVRRPCSDGDIALKLLEKLLRNGAAVRLAALAPGVLWPMPEKTKIALVVKSLGNGFFDAANKGAQEAAKELGGVEVIYTGPTTPTAEGQIEVINSLIARRSTPSPSRPTTRTRSCRL
jgi:hypothetical protein